MVIVFTRVYPMQMKDCRRTPIRLNLKAWSKNTLKKPFLFPRLFNDWKKC